MIESNARPRGQKPTDEEIEAARQKGRPDLPEGMSRSQWKKEQRHLRWEETKTEYRRGKKMQKKAALKRKREAQAELGPEHYHQAKKVKPQSQVETNVHTIFDCDFDELMNDKEIVLMLNQITRSYSAKRHSSHHVSLKISSFNKRLKARFDTRVLQYPQWKGIEFEENEKLEDLLPTDETERAKFVYLTADTDEILEELEPGHTYIIGGIVDKNRHKRLCVEKAIKLGLRVGKLPIDKYIEMNGRQVLATSHVYELCCQWFEQGKDWNKAFNQVLPPRKLKIASESNDDNDDEGIEDGDVEPETSVQAQKQVLTDTTHDESGAVESD